MVGPLHQNQKIQEESIKQQKSINYDEQVKTGELDSIIHLAIPKIQSGDAFSVQYLVNQNQFDINSQDLDGETLLYHAAQQGHVDVVQALMKIPEIDVNKSAQSGETPLYVAANLGFYSVVKALLQSPKIDVNKPVEKKSVVHEKCENFTNNDTTSKIGKLNCYFTENILQNNEKNTEKQKNNNITYDKNCGLSVLMCICGYAQYIEKLDGWKFFAEGQRVRNFEEDEGEQDFKNLLLNHNVKIVLKCQQQENFESRIVQVRPKISTYCEIVKLLLNHENIDVNMRDYEGKTALLHACKFGHAKFVKLLVDNGANINAIQKIQNDKILSKIQTQDLRKIQSQSWLESEIKNLNATEFQRTVLHEIAETDIERDEKFNVLFSQPDLEPNLQGVIYFNLNGDEIVVNGNILIASVLEKFKEDNAASLKGIFKMSSKSVYTFDITTEFFCVKNNQKFENILDFLIYHKQVGLVSAIFQGFLDNQIKISQLKYFVRAFPDMSKNEDFTKVLVNFVENEEPIVQRIINKDSNTEIDLGMPVVSFLHNLIENAENFRIFSSIIIKSAIESLWTKKTIWYYRIYFAIFFIYLILIIAAFSTHINNTIRIRDFEAQQINIPKNERQSFTNENNVRPILWATLPPLFLMLLGEILQLNFSSFKNPLHQNFNFLVQNFEDFIGIFIHSFFSIGKFSNLLDWFIISVGFFLPIFWSPENDSLMALTAFFLITLFFRLLIWSLPIKQFGHYILMMAFMMLKTFSLIILLMVMIVFFAMSFMLIFQKNEFDLEDDETKEFGYELLNTATGLFGNIDVGSFYQLDNPYFSLGLSLLAIFMVIVPILFINLLIALMTPIYEQVAQQRDEAFYRNKAFIGLEAIQFFENLGKIIPYFANNQTSSFFVELKGGLSRGESRERHVYEVLAEYFLNVQNNFTKIQNNFARIDQQLAAIEQKIDRKID